MANKKKAALSAAPDQAGQATKQTAARPVKKLVPETAKKKAESGKVEKAARRGKPEKKSKAGKVITAEKPVKQGEPEKKIKPAKAAKPARPVAHAASATEARTGTATLISTKTVYQGPLFRVQHDTLIEPGGKPSERDVIRHNGSVVILAIDSSRSRKNPYVVMEHQYRHAANQYLWELPAGKLEPGEDALAGAQRELAEETGYRAKKWKPLVEYFASPGFLGEAMKVFLAEGLVAGDATPEEDEDIDFRLVKLSEILKMIEKGAIKDGKTLSSVLLYAHLHGGRKHHKHGK